MPSKIFHPSDLDILRNATLQEINALEPNLPPITLKDISEGELGQWNGFVWKTEGKE